MTYGYGYMYRVHMRIEMNSASRLAFHFHKSHEFLFKIGKQGLHTIIPNFREDMRAKCSCFSYRIRGNPVRDIYLVTDHFTSI